MQYSVMEEKDISQVLLLSEELHKSVRPDYYHFSPEEMLKKLILFLSRDERECFVARDDDVIIGFFLCAASRATGSNQLEASEMGVYVMPEYRKQGVAREFIRLYEEWAKSIGCVSASFSDSKKESERYSYKTVKNAGYEIASIVYRKKL